jgi:hypothetical protein
MRVAEDGDTYYSVVSGLHVRFVSRVDGEVDLVMCVVTDLSV